MRFFCRSSSLLNVLCLAFSLASSQQASAAATGTGHAGDADSARLQEVKAAFDLNWNAYKKYAMNFDKLAPISKKGVFDSTLAGFKGTIVDSLSTHIIMGNGDSPEYKQLLDIVSKIDFTTTQQGITTPGEVSIFEMTIRYIGGLTSAFQLNGERKEEEFLIKQAQVLADGLSAGWYQKNKIPFNNVNLNTRRPQSIDKDVNLAQAGTLTMEWSMLSKYTGNNKYAQLATGSVDAILASKPYFPSLWETRIWPQNNTASGKYITTGGGCDSFLEYLIKYPLLLDDKGHHFAQTYGKMLTTIQDKLVSKTGVNNLTFIADYNTDKKEIAYVGSHLASFFGGNIAMAGQLFNRPDWTQLGLEITESYYQSYRATVSGIGAYGIGWFDKRGSTSGWGWVNSGRRDFYNKNGLFVHVGDWVQEPETIESLFYAWRITRDVRFRDMAWEAFQQIKKHASTETAYAGIVNVNDASSDLYDQTETFLYAELFKYLYLIFSDSDSYSLDEYVFTTEAHLFKRGSASATSSSTTSSSRPMAMKTKGGSNSGGWGKIQGTGFKYQWLMADSKASVTDAHIPVEAHPSGEKPPNVLELQAGADRTQRILSLCSQLGIDPAVAKGILSRLPKDGATTSSSSSSTVDV